MRKMLTLACALWLMLCGAFAQETDGAFVYAGALKEGYDLERLATDALVNIPLAGGRCEVIGKSVEGRDLYALYIGTGEAHVLITGGAHGNEVASTPLMMQAAFDLLALYQKGDAETVERLNQSTLVLVPLVNPDRYALAQPAHSAGKLYSTKTNINGVNLNRNYPAPFFGTDTPEGNANPGTPGSEPETQAIMALLEKHSFYAVMDMHSRGRLVYFGKRGMPDESIQGGLTTKQMDQLTHQLGYTVRPRHEDYLVIRAEKVAYGNTGSLTDYCCTLGIPAVTLETMEKSPYTPYAIRCEYGILGLHKVFQRLCKFGYRVSTEGASAYLQ